MSSQSHLASDVRTITWQSTSKLRSMVLHAEQRDVCSARGAACRYHNTISINVEWIVVCERDSCRPENHVLTTSLIINYLNLMVTLPVHAYQLTLVCIRNVAIDDAPVSLAHAHLLWELHECIERLLAYLWIITVPLVARECEYEQEEILERRRKNGA